MIARGEGGGAGQNWGEGNICNSVNNMNKEKKVKSSLGHLAKKILLRIKTKKLPLDLSIRRLSLIVEGAE